MNAPHEIWRDQSVAAMSIQEEFGARNALGYLVGEKLLHAFARTLPDFVSAVRELFEPHVHREYLDSVKRVGAQGQVMDDETFERARGMFREDVVSAAEAVGPDGEDQGDVPALSRATT